jgi:hypothetical protein
MIEAANKPEARKNNGMRNTMKTKLILFQNSGARPEITVHCTA